MGRFERRLKRAIASNRRAKLRKMKRIKENREERIALQKLNQYESNKKKPKGS